MPRIDPLVYKAIYKIPTTQFLSEEHPNENAALLFDQINPLFNRTLDQSLLNPLRPKDISTCSVEDDKAAVKYYKGVIEKVKAAIENMPNGEKFLGDVQAQEHGFAILSSEQLEKHLKSLTPEQLSAVFVNSAKSGLLFVVKAVLEHPNFAQIDQTKILKALTGAADEGRQNIIMTCLTHPNVGRFLTAETKGEVLKSAAKNGLAEVVKTILGQQDFATIPALQIEEAIRESVKEKHPDLGLAILKKLDLATFPIENLINLATQLLWKQMSITDLKNCAPLMKKLGEMIVAHPQFRAASSDDLNKLGHCALFFDRVTLDAIKNHPQFRNQDLKFAANVLELVENLTNPISIPEVQKLVVVKDPAYLFELAFPPAITLDAIGAEPHPEALEGILAYATITGYQQMISAILHNNKFRNVLPQEKLLNMVAEVYDAQTVELYRNELNG